MLKESNVLRSAFWFIFLIILCFSTPALAGKTEDWKTLADFQDTYGPFQSRYSAKRLDKAYVEKWNQWKKTFQPFAQQFKKDYGADINALRQAFNDVKLPEGVSNYPHHMIDLLNLDVDSRQKEIAGWFKSKGDEAFARWKNFTNVPKEKLELKADYADRARNDYQLAESLAAGSATAELDQAKKAYKKSLKEWESVLKELAWPGNNPDFEGPGDPDDLAEAALKLLNTMQKEGRAWSKPEYDDVHIPVAACVVGSGWEVYKKTPIKKIPTQYTLKMFVLFKGKKSDNIGYGYYMQFYTREEAGVKKAPPFLYCNSRSYEKQKMLLSAAPSGGSGSSGFMGVIGFFFRLILSAALITGGLAAAGSFYATKIPALSPVVDAFRSKTTVLGPVLFITGAFFLLLSFLTLSPLSNLLPQVAAIALGLVLFASAGVPEAGNEKLDAPIRQVTGKLAPVTKALAPFETLIGQAALALGLIHLLIGGVPLF
ncbi:MAG: hypothetical protein CSA22_05840 [Deltaproteobacteria bacterium]|nr:MAG: hypothetical protein CSA22_05840 [Deltaproteobacteria bacterium]